jgi:hypothetical protein
MKLINLAGEYPGMINLLEMPNFSLAKSNGYFARYLTLGESR